MNEVYYNCNCDCNYIYNYYYTQLPLPLQLPLLPHSIFLSADPTFLALSSARFDAK